MLSLGRLPTLPRRRRSNHLPDALRARLLAIPASASGAAIVPRPARGRDLATWLWASPFMPLGASFAVAVALGLVGGNPYRLGVATADRVHARAAPVAAELGGRAAELGAEAVELGRAAVDLVPRAGLYASRTLTASLAERFLGDVEEEAVR